MGMGKTATATATGKRSLQTHLLRLFASTSSSMACVRLPSAPSWTSSHVLRTSSQRSRVAPVAPAAPVVKPLWSAE